MAKAILRLVGKKVVKVVSRDRQTVVSLLHRSGNSPSSTGGTAHEHAHGVGYPTTLQGNASSKQLLATMYVHEYWQ